MNNEMERAKEIDDAVRAADAKKRADAEEAAMAGEKLDKVIAHLDSLGKRMDEWEKSKSKDEEGESEMEGEIEKDKPRELAADSQVRKDSAETLEEIENHKLKIGPTYKVAADSVLAEIQSEAQRASDAWAKQTVHPWEGESVTAYRRRVAKEHQQHSPLWKNVDLHTLSGQALRNATAQIYADSIAASTSPDSYPDTLIERINVDRATGQRMITFHGNPSAWTNQFKSGRQFVTKFRTGGGWRRED
jgi:hypothetical protein